MGKERKRPPGQKAYADYYLPQVDPKGCSGAEAKSIDEFMKDVLETGPNSGRQNNEEVVKRVKRKVVTVKGGSRYFLGRVEKKQKKNISSRLAASLGSEAWRRQKGLDDLSNVPYSAVSRVHELWVSYAQDVMKMYRRQEDAVLEMDMHGAFLQVVRSRNPMVVGLGGVVLKEEKGAFLIVSQDGRRAKVQKRGSEFEMKINGVKVFIDGTMLYKIQNGLEKPIKFKV